MPEIGAYSPRGGLAVTDQFPINPDFGAIESQRYFPNHRPLLVFLITLAVWQCSTLFLQAQIGGPVPTTLAALEAYPSYFHRMEIVILAQAAGDRDEVFVTDGKRRLRTFNIPPPLSSDPEIIEIRGTYWDVGRLDPDDPRLAGYNIKQVSELSLGKPWPSSGELKLLIADSTQRANRSGDTTIRTLSLEPSRYRDQLVTLTGRFRGRNLYGDLPEAPGVTLDDFILKSNGASVWVVGMEPSGRGFHLDVTARVDTSRWLQITGVVSGRDQLIEVVAESIDVIDRPAAARNSVTAIPQAQGPAPEVIFSTPTPDDTEVGTKGLVRFQFSRDMRATSFGDHIKAFYVGTRTALELTVEYRPRNRVLSVQFAEPLLTYHQVEVNLADGILATDGANLVPHTLRFATGGQ